MPKTLRLFLPVVLLVALFAACTSEPTRTTSITNVTHLPTGTVNLRWNPMTEQLTVFLHLTGLTPSRIHLAHISHQGICQTDGAMLFALKPIVANVHGIGTSQTVLDHITNGIPVTGWSVNVYNSSQQTSADRFLPIACTPIHNVRSSHILTYILEPMGAVGQKAFGLARLSVARQ